MNYSTFAKKGDATNKKVLGQALRLVKENLEPHKEQYKIYNILGFGRVLEGVAYYHEVDQFYNCIGIEVEIESQIEFSHEGKTHLGDIQREVGFYSIWKGKSSAYAPVTFETGNGDLGESYRFDNGCGDHIEVSKVIYTVEEVNEVVKAIGLMESSK